MIWIIVCLNHDSQIIVNVFKTDTAKKNPAVTWSHRSQKTGSKLAQLIRGRGYCSLKTTFNLMYWDFWGTIRDFHFYTLHQIRLVIDISMSQPTLYRWVSARKTPLLTHWSYVFLAQTHRYLHVLWGRWVNHHHSLQYLIIDTTQPSMGNGPIYIWGLDLLQGRAWSDQISTLSSWKGFLTHCGLVTPNGDRDMDKHWLR